MKRFLTIISIMVAMPYLLFSQTVEEQHKINMALLEAIDMYEYTLNLTDEEKYLNYIGQFTSPQVSVYNDLLGLCYEETISAEEYGHMLLESGYLFTVNLIDIKKGDMEYNNDYTYIPVEFQKEIEYTDKRGVLYSSSEFYGKHHNVTVTFVYDSGTGTCLIDRIDGSIDSDRKLAKNHLVLQRYDEKSALLYRKIIFGDGDKLKFNKANQAFFEEGFRNKGYKAQIKTADNDEYVRLVKDKANPGLAKLKINRKTGRLNFRYAMSPMNAITIDEDENYKSVTSQSYEYGADLGLMFASTKKTRFGLFAGFAKSSSTMSVINENVTLSTERTDDILTENRLEGQTQDFEFTDMAVRAFMNFEHTVINRLSIVWSVGMKGYFNGTCNIGEYRLIDASISSYLDQETGDMVEVENSRIPYSFNSFTEGTGEIIGSSFTLSAMANLGVNAYLSRSISVNVRAGYELGIGDYCEFLNPDSKDANLSGNMATVPFVSHFIAKRGGLWIEGGLTFKFF